jgi:hypothetical protein
VHFFKSAKFAELTHTVSEAPLPEAAAQWTLAVYARPMETLLGLPAEAAADCLSHAENVAIEHDRALVCFNRHARPLMADVFGPARLFFDRDQSDLGFFARLFEPDLDS